ncbi:MAG TPA: 2-phospho-L-lactate guanylyltransferase [Candidatus Limnocylindria bacterium]|nr:2-phospho-L-lactate guanylyltransferase [Candidatus Limnocylindria bacterium]
MSIRIIVPHRGLGVAKTRLEPVLSPDARTALADQLLRHVLGVAVGVAETVVISPSLDLGPLVEACGSRLVVQRGMGLNAGLDQARADALADGISLLGVLHGDLPNLTAEDVEMLLAAAPTPRGVAIATDKTGSGTNGLALRPPSALRFSFGVDSFAKHRAAAAALPFVVVDRPGLAFDLDTPADLARWLELGDAA